MRRKEMMSAVARVIADKGLPGVTFSGYASFMTLLGYQVLSTFEDEYDAPVYLLLQSRNGKYCLLLTFRGCCDSCDALQKCEDLGEVMELADALRSQIRWVSKKTCLAAIEVEMGRYAKEYDDSTDQGITDFLMDTAMTVQTGDIS